MIKLDRFHGFRPTPQRPLTPEEISAETALRLRMDLFRQKVRDTTGGRRLRRMSQAEAALRVQQQESKGGSSL